MAEGDLVHDPNTNNPPETLDSQVRRAHAGFLALAKEWIESVERAPAVIETDEINERIGATIKKLTTIATAAKMHHTTAKAPHLENCRAIDAIFLTGVVKAAEDAKAVLLPRQRAFLRKKADAAEAAARAEAERLRIEQEDAMRDAERAQDQGDTDAAIKLLDTATAAEEAATVAEKRADGPVADHVRVHSTLGVTVSAQTEWVTEYVGPRDKIDWAVIGPYIADKDILRAAKAAVKAGRREIAGFKITSDLKPINR